tara:strand:- start:12739 stop:12945 length:207 start_codon:yes stop_codon:yes gene_type:complete
MSDTVVTMKHIVYVKRQINFGEANYYPTCDTGKKMIRIMGVGKVVFKSDDINRWKELGFSFEIQQETL